MPFFEDFIESVHDGPSIDSPQKHFRSNSLVLSSFQGTVLISTNRLESLISLYFDGGSRKGMQASSNITSQSGFHFVSISSKVASFLQPTQDKEIVFDTKPTSCCVVCEVIWLKQHENMSYHITFDHTEYLGPEEHPDVLSYGGISVYFIDDTNTSQEIITISHSSPIKRTNNATLWKKGYPVVSKITTKYVVLVYYFYPQFSSMRGKLLVSTTPCVGVYIPLFRLKKRHHLISFDNSCLPLYTCFQLRTPSNCIVLTFLNFLKNLPVKRIIDVVNFDDSYTPMRMFSADQLLKTRAAKERKQAEFQLHAYRMGYFAFFPTGGDIFQSDIFQLEKLVSTTSDIFLPRYLKKISPDLNFGNPKIKFQALEIQKFASATQERFYLVSAVPPKGIALSFLDVDLFSFYDSWVTILTQFFSPEKPVQFLHSLLPHANLFSPFNKQLALTYLSGKIDFANKTRQLCLTLDCTNDTYKMILQISQAEWLKVRREIFSGINQTESAIYLEIKGTKLTQGTTLVMSYDLGILEKHLHFALNLSLEDVFMIVPSTNVPRCQICRIIEQPSVWQTLDTCKVLTLYVAPCLPPGQRAIILHHTNAPLTLNLEEQRHTPSLNPQCIGSTACFSQFKSWTEAHVLCRQKGMHLPSVHSSRDMEIIKDLLKIYENSFSTYKHDKTKDHCVSWIDKMYVPGWGGIGVCGTPHYL